jgi:hypothetical protein
LLTPVKIVARLAGKGIPIQAAAHYSAYDTYAMGARLKSRALGPLQRRFFVMKRHFSDKERAFFMEVDFSNHVALVVLAEEAGKHVIVGGGRYIVFEPGRAG